MKFEVLKGTKDSLCEEQIQMNKILDVMRRNFEKFGLKPFDTPLIEYFDTLINKYKKEDEIVQEIFKVTDRGKRQLGLRYDLTVPLCRFVASQKQLKLPFKRYQVGKVFRDGPIKSGRAREFMQCDADVVGIEGQEIEAEMLSLFYNTYKDLGIKATIEINNNKILRGAFLEQGFKEKDLQILILSVDKLKKIGKKEVLNEIKTKKIDSKKASLAIDTLSAKTVAEIKKNAKNKELLEGIFELEKLVEYLKVLKVNYRINFSMSRGLVIYTGNIWEAYDLQEKIKSSIGSGGRYDKAIGNFIGNDKSYPALGISFGIVPMMECLRNENENKITDVLVVPLTNTLTTTAMKIANQLRKTKNVEISYDYKLKKAFSYAESNNIDKLAIIGERDIKENRYTLKDIKTKKEKKVKI